MSRRNSNTKRVNQGKQSRKDSSTKRVNLDNERVTRFIKDEDNKMNDVRWYASSPELLRSAASLPFSQTVGSKPVLGNNHAVPGVMAIEFSPSIGGNTIDPINQAANMMYSFTVHANSRNTNYNAPDEMLVVIAAANLFAGIAHGVRAYGTMKWYDQQNSYMPDTLIMAMGFDPQDLRGNLGQMWFDLNQLIARSKQIWVPTTMPVFERWVWMCSNIYEDADSIKAQKYLYVPTMLYQYQEMTTEHPEGHLIPNKWIVEPTTPDPTHPGCPVLHKWSDYMYMMNSMFKSLLDSEDRGIIMGDILKAYGSDKLYSMNEISADYTVKPVYNAEVLTQIENATAANIYSGGIYQSVGSNTVYETFIKKDDPDPATLLFPGKGILNFHTSGVPTPEDIMVATRLMTLGTSYNPLSKTVSPTACGTEYCNNFRFYTRAFNQDGSSIVGGRSYQSTNSFNAETGQYILYNYIWEELISFDWSPWLYASKLDDITAWWANGTPVSDWNATPYSGIGDYDNYTFVDIQNIQQMHETALYSEFGVPHV